MPLHSTAVRDLGPLNELAEVDLSRNALADFAFLEALAALPALRRLDLSANPVASMPEYRETVLRLLPKLEMLDGRCVRGRPQCAAHRCASTDPRDAATAALSPSPRGSTSDSRTRTRPA